MNDNQLGTEFFNERAAIREHEGLLTRADAERLGMLDTQEYLHACEVRSLAKMPESKRLERLKGIEIKRGADAVRKIKADIAELFKAKNKRLNGIQVKSRG